jgi:hypothetical protein
MSFPSPLALAANKGVAEPEPIEEDEHHDSTS